MFCVSCNVATIKWLDANSILTSTSLILFKSWKSVSRPCLPCFWWYQCAHFLRHPHFGYFRYFFVDFYVFSLFLSFFSPFYFFVYLTRSEGFLYISRLNSFRTLDWIPYYSSALRFSFIYFSFEFFWTLGTLQNLNS